MKLFRLTNNFAIALVIGMGSCHPHPPIPIPPIPPTPIPPVTINIPSLVPNGTYFKKDNGERITLIGVTDFALYKLYLEGTDIGPILDDREGFNYHRVFLTAQNLFDLNPANYPNFYTDLVKFTQLFAKRNRYVELVIFADAAILFKNEQDEIDHYNKVINAVQGQTNVLLELVNENDQTPNIINPALFPCITTLPFSMGSNGSQASPVRPWCGYETFHTNGAFEWQRKGGHNGMEFSVGAEGITASHVPILADENTRYPDVDNNLKHYYDAAAASALLIAGSTYHCDGCRWSKPFTELEKSGAKAHIDGANSVPLDCQDGAYRRRDDLLTSERLRVYQRGDDDRCIVPVRN